MNIFNEISLVFFSTTAGHFSFTDIYKYSLKHLDKNIGLDNFGNKYAAIKVHNNQEDRFTEMTSYLKGFNILKEIGKNVGDNPHLNHDNYNNYMVNTYSSSIANIFSSFRFETEFILWLEDDCILVSDDYSKYIKEGIDLLKKNKDIFSVHTDSIQFAPDNIELFNDCKYAFRPHLFRIKDFINVVNVFKNNYEQVKYFHPEGIYDRIIKLVYPNTKFVMYNSKFLAQEHLGQADFPALKEKFKLEL